MPRPLSKTFGVLLMASASLLAIPGTTRAAAPTLTECVAANEKAGPLQHAGKLREARASLLLCAASTCPAVVRDDCIKGETQLAQAIPSVVFEAKDAAGNDLSAVKVTIDGELLADKLLGSAIDVDPGEHSFRFESAGLPPLEKRFIIHVAEKNRRERIVLGTAPPAASPLVAPPSRPVHAESAGAGGGSQKSVGVVLVGIGLAGVAVGSVFGILANSTWQQALRDCPGGCPIGPGVPARSEESRAHTFATVADIAFPVGGAAVLAGAALWLLAPRAQSPLGMRVAPFLVGSSGAGIVAGGSLP